MTVCGCAVPNTESVLSGNPSTPNSEAISSLPSVTSVPSSVVSSVRQEPSEPSTVSEDIGEWITQAEFDGFYENVLPEVVILVCGQQAYDPDDYIIDEFVYYRVTDEKYDTVNKLKSEFAKYFTTEYIDENFDLYFEAGEPYKEKDGVIYVYNNTIGATSKFENHFLFEDIIQVFSNQAEPSLYFYFDMDYFNGKWKISDVNYEIVYSHNTPTPAMKPVIYLYPDKVTDVTVKLYLKGTLGCTYPAYPKDGWKVTAYPNGKLIVDGEEYNYLFWEGELNTVFTFDKGFCVKGADTAALLKNALSEMGLIPSEYNDFIVYWLPQMEKNAFNLISFADVDYTDHAKLEITPKPDSTLRVFMIFKPVEKPITIAPQSFEKFERNGFTVVEWGGAQID